MVDRQSVVAAYQLAEAFGAHVEQPPRISRKGTRLHELWLQNPDGTLIEIYARLTNIQLAEKPADELRVFLVPGTDPESA